MGVEGLGGGAPRSLNRLCCRFVGSVGGLKKLRPPEVDYVDNVLLEFIVAVELQKADEPMLKNILPVLLGEKDPYGRYEVMKPEPKP